MRKNSLKIHVKTLCVKFSPLYRPTILETLMTAKRAQTRNVSKPKLDSFFHESFGIL